MPRNVGGDDPVVDPAALWAAGEPATEPAVSLEVEPAPPTQLASPDEDVILPVILADAEVGDVVPPGEVLPVASSANDLTPEVARSCPNRHPVSTKAKFCPECGAGMVPAEPTEWTCQCGYRNDAFAKFCPECGSASPARQAPVAGAGLAVELMARVTPAAELSPEERARREAQHVAAVRDGSAMPEPRYQPVQAGAETVLIHMVADGLTFAGQVWFRGQELELEVGSLRWQQAQAWINLSDFDQVERYGEIKFRHGPWPGKRYIDGVGGFQQLLPMDKQAAEQGARISGPTEEQLLQAELAERRRGRSVPQPSLR